MNNELAEPPPPFFLPHYNLSHLLLIVIRCFQSISEMMRIHCCPPFVSFRFVCLLPNFRFSIMILGKACWPIKLPRLRGSLQAAKWRVFVSGLGCPWTGCSRLTAIGSLTRDKNAGQQESAQIGFRRVLRSWLNGADRVIERIRWSS